MTVKPENQILSDDSAPSLESLKVKIDTAMRNNDAPETSTPPPSSAGLRIGLDLVSGVSVGTLIGYSIDQWLNTLPIFLVICFILGTAAGVRLMMQTASRINTSLDTEEKCTKNAEQKDKGE